MKSEKIKILVSLSSDTWHGHGSETLWGEIVSPGEAKVLNSPFFAKGVSYMDVVKISPVENGLANFESVAEQGGHSTYRLIPDREVEKDELQSMLAPLVELGCSYEGTGGKPLVIALDVPPGVDVSNVYSILEQGEKDGRWGFEEGNYYSG